MTKKDIKAAVSVKSAAIATVLASPTTIFAQADDLNEGIRIATPNNVEGTVGVFDDNGLFDRIASTLLLIVGALSVIMLIIGGIRYVVSAGDQNAVQGAKNTILYAIVGIVVSFLAFTAVQFVVDQLAGA